MIVENLDSISEYIKELMTVIKDCVQKMDITIRQAEVKYASIEA